MDRGMDREEGWDRAQHVDVHTRLWLLSIFFPFSFRFVGEGGGGGGCAVLFRFFLISFFFFHGGCRGGKGFLSFTPSFFFSSSSSVFYFRRFYFLAPPPSPPDNEPLGLTTAYPFSGDVPWKKLPSIYSFIRYLPPLLFSSPFLTLSYPIPLPPQKQFGSLRYIDMGRFSLASTFSPPQFLSLRSLRGVAVFFRGGRGRVWSKRGRRKGGKSGRLLKAGKGRNEFVEC